jgi:hypothetical protein
MPDILAAGSANNSTKSYVTGGAGFHYTVKTPEKSSKCPIAFSSEVDTGSRKENASKHESGASVLI